MIMPLISFSRLGWVLSASLNPYVSFNDLINSQCSAYHFYMDDSNGNFKTRSLYLAERLKHSDGRRQAGIQACRQFGSRIQVFGPKIQNSTCILRELAREKE